MFFVKVVCSHEPTLRRRVYSLVDANALLQRLASEGHIINFFSVERID